MEVQSRIKAALEIVEQGQPFRVGSLLISKLDNNTLAVTGWTQYFHLDSLTQGIVLEELQAVKEDFENLITASKDWMNYAKNKFIEYNLAYNDYGKVGIGICKERNGQVLWLTDVKS